MALMCIFIVSLIAQIATGAAVGCANNTRLLELIIEGQKEQMVVLKEILNKDSLSTTTALPGAASIAVNYIRYGHKSCPNTAEMIYDGYVGKSYYSYGGGVNYLCLPKDPEWPAGAASGYQSKSYIYGVEYEQNYSPVVPSGVWQHDVPCAVCEAKEKSQVLMIPGKKTCPSGWTAEYSGILMAEHYQHKPSDYACVDSAMQADSGGHENKNGGLFYVVEAVCGSLPCPPYKDGYELSCVVCTK